jgi:hypothetical protein
LLRSHRLLPGHGIGDVGRHRVDERGVPPQKLVDLDEFFRLARAILAVSIGPIRSPPLLPTLSFSATHDAPAGAFLLTSGHLAETPVIARHYKISRGAPISSIGAVPYPFLGGL